MDSHCVVWKLDTDEISWFYIHTPGEYLQFTVDSDRLALTQQNSHSQDESTVTVWDFRTQILRTIELSS